MTACRRALMLDIESSTTADERGGMAGSNRAGKAGKWSAAPWKTALFGWLAFALVDGGLSTEESVSHGIRRTAGTVTSAAIIMVAVFSIFGTLSMIKMKQLGVGLAIAVLIDATISRGVLLPATMKLLGEWNWYMPRSLAWVPRLAPEASGSPQRLAAGH